MAVFIGESKAVKGRDDKDKLTRELKRLRAELARLKEAEIRYREIERKLRKEKEFTSTLVEAYPAFFVAIDPDGKTLMMNKAMLEALGYAADEVVGKDYLSNFVPEGDRERLSGIFERLTKDRQPTENENRVLTRDGRELLVEWHGRPVFDDFFN